MVSEDDKGRSRGILSASDRVFLQNREQYAKEHSRQAVDKRIREIQERAANAIVDFPLLFEGLEEEERKRIFAGEPLHRDDHEPPEPLDEMVAEGLVYAIAFFYLETFRHKHFYFKKILDSGVNTAERRISGIEDDPRRVVTVDFDVDRIEYRHVRRAVGRLMEREYRDIPEEDQAAIIWLLERYATTEQLEDIKRRYEDDAEEIERELQEESQSASEYERKKREEQVEERRERLDSEE